VVIAKAHNQRELLRDPTAHAVMIAYTQASSHLQSWRLDNTRMYALELRPMWLADRSRNSKLYSAPAT
jgi:hypothetical protein